MATVVFVILMLALSFACLLSLVFMVYSSYLIYVHWMYSHIPGPKRDNFFSGNYPLLQREGKRGKILHEVVEDLRVNYGPVMVIWVYHRPILFVSDPEVARKCLVTLNLPKNSFGAKNFAFPYGQRFVGNGLVTELDHGVWQKRRSLLNPAFHRRYLMNLMTAFNSSCDLFLNNLDEMADGKTVVDMAEEFARVTMDVIGKVAFDVDLDVIRDKNSPFPAALTETLKGVQESFFAPFWRVDLSSISVRKRLSKTTKFLRDYAKKVIQERQEAISRKDDTPSDILNHILFVAKAEPSLTLEYLVDEFVTFFVAGQETTSNQLSFTLYEILKHPHIEDRIVQEIESVLGSCQFVKYNDLGNLVYLGQTLKEGLRLHSPVGGTSRITVEEEELGGYLVPGNTSVSVSLFVLHHIPEVWLEPKKFDPDRFSPESKISSNALRSAYFPFSFGPRTCIGQTFAQFEARVLMARLLQEFELTLLEGQNEIQHEQRLTVKPRGGVLCTIKRRGDNQR